ncbi:hypothetical protein Trydic_g12247 [Trypoxylus dichotomus]
MQPISQYRFQQVNNVYAYLRLRIQPDSTFLTLYTLQDSFSITRGRVKLTSISNKNLQRKELIFDFIDFRII